MNYIRTFFLVFFCILFHPTKQVFAQETDYIGAYEAGVNLGAAWQSGDVPAWLRGWAAGLTLGKNLYARPEDWLAFDMRGRLLAGQTFGLDEAPFSGIRNNPALNGSFPTLPDYTGLGFVFRNYRTTHFELGAEAVFSLQQLRERKKLILSAFGGFGIHWYMVRINQQDANGETYAPLYSSLGNKPSKSEIRKELREALSGSAFETPADQFDGGFAKAGFMPSIGLELGYQLNPSLALTLGHRLTFSGTDLLDGERWNADNTRSEDKDLLHFTSINLRWRSPGWGNIGRGRTFNNQPSPPNTGPVLPPKRKAPLVSIRSLSAPEPLGEEPSCRSELRVRIENVERKDQITLLVNEKKILTFSFDVEANELSAEISLETGLNIVNVKASNRYGTEEDQTSAWCRLEEKQETPAVRFVEPADQMVTDRRRITIKAEVKGVEGKEDLIFRQNGQERASFSFSRSSGLFQVVADLAEGKNRFSLEASNSSGKAKDTLSVRFQPPAIPRPVIEILSVSEPSSNPFNPNIYRTTVLARIRYIEEASQISFVVNGVPETEFTFDPGKNEFWGKAQVNEGENSLIIRAMNESGTTEVNHLLDF